MRPSLSLDALASKRVLQSPVNYIQNKRLQLDYSHKRLLAASQQLLAGKKQQFIRLTAALDAMSPEERAAMEAEKQARIQAAKEKAAAKKAGQSEA